MADLWQRDRIRRCIIEPMMARWSAPPNADEKALLADIEQDLAGFTEEELQTGFTIVRHEMGGRVKWPTAAQFRTACLAAKRGVPSEGGVGDSVQKDTASNYRKACDAMRSPTGQRAIAGGFAVSYFEHVRRGGNADLSENQEREMVMAVQNAAVFVDDLRRQTDINPFAHSLIGMHDGMLQREARLAEEFGGGQK